MQGMMLVCLVAFATLVAAAPKHIDLSQMQDVPHAVAEHQVEGILQTHDKQIVPHHEVQLWEMSPAVSEALSTENAAHAQNGQELKLFGKFIARTTTDATGGFTFDVPTADQYVVTAMVEGRRAQGVISSSTKETRTRRGANRRSYNILYTPPPLICRQWIVRTTYDATATCGWVPFAYTPYNNNPVTRLMYPGGETMLCQNGVPGNPSTCDMSYWRYTSAAYGFGVGALCAESNNDEAYGVWTIFENQNGRDYNFGIYAPGGDVHLKRNDDAAAIYVWRSAGNTVPVLETIAKLNSSLTYVENTNGQFWNALRLRITTPSACQDWTDTSADLLAGSGVPFYKTNIRCGPYNSTGSDDRQPFEGTTARKCGVNV